MLKFWLLLLTLSLSLPVYATKLYQWTDEEGNIHYSQTPPANTQAESKEIKGGVNTDKSTQQPAQNNAAPQENATNTQQSTRENSESCQRARHQLSQLQVEGELVISVPDKNNPGEKKLVPMSEEERQQRIQAAQSYIDAYCQAAQPEAEAEEEEIEAPTARPVPGEEE